MDSLLSTLFYTAFAAVLVGATLLVNAKRRWVPALAFVLLLALDDLLTTLPHLWRALDVLPGRWNWEGKLLSVAASLVVLALTSLTRREVGLTWRQRAGSVRPAALLTFILAVAGFLIGFMFDGGGFTAETFAFQFTMPGLAEELVYRGTLLALLHRAMPSASGWRAWMPLLVTSVIFGLWHGLGVDDGHITFDALAFVFPFIGGIGFGWLREKTGSLLFPILAHNLSNTAGLLGALL